MAKKIVAQVYVQLSCVLSGHPDNPGPGDKVFVDAEQAAQLIEMGVAKQADLPDEPAATEATGPSDPSSPTDSTEASQPSDPTEPSKPTEPGQNA